MLKASLYTASHLLQVIRLLEAIQLYKSSHLMFPQFLNNKISAIEDASDYKLTCLLLIGFIEPEEQFTSLSAASASNLT